VNPFNKYPHPVNFTFADRFSDGRITLGGDHCELHTTAVADGVHHVRVVAPERWPEEDHRDTRELWQGDATAAVKPSLLKISPAAGFSLMSTAGKQLLEAEDRGWLGVSGRRWLFRFKGQPELQFYGLGEKHTPFERSGRSYQFWNTDAWADHPMEHIRDGDYDPDYLSVPYLIIKQDNSFIGLLVDTPYPATISLSDVAPLVQSIEPKQRQPPDILVGANDGPPSLVILLGPSLAELTRRFQMLTGPTPLPPLWSLGYHQSRWGYRSASDLNRLAHRFERHHFPVDGLWLDIDYMDGYRIFTFDPHHLPHPAETVAAMKKRRIRVVPILDPGIKREAGYPVYESGRAAGVFCLNTAGGLFTGWVWPGFTVFPDFSLPETRLWWAALARRFFESGFEGAWLDMNDPSTGSIDCREMRFDHGRLPHEAGHNRYALLMARATRDGLLAARPDQRPFLLSRSGSTGSQRYCAHWTGDNFSTYGHLHRSIGKSLNLALSGIPFNGADVGGFGGDCTEALLIDWIKAAFLMPFLRNHTMRGSRAQEPWRYSHRALVVIRRFVRLRYTLLPYLYNLFVDQEERGSAILRPLFHDFKDSRALPLGWIDDQFMVGPSIMQAPFVHEKGALRDVVLPACKWLRADTGRWVQGGRHLTVKRRAGSTPLFLREGSLIPFQPGERTTNGKDLNHIGLLCCLSPGFTGDARLAYCADDGYSFAYRRGRRTRLQVAARLIDRRLILSIRTLAQGFGKVEIIPFSVNRFQAIHLNVDGQVHILHPLKKTVQLTGRPFDWYRWMI
jgi:alpha-glucosidase